MTGFNEPKSPLTSARVFDKKSDAELADWLDNDAQAMDGQPGQNNHVAAARAAAERLRRLAEHDAQVRAEALEAADQRAAECAAALEATTDVRDALWRRLQITVRERNQYAAALEAADQRAELAEANLSVEESKNAGYRAKNDQLAAVVEKAEDFVTRHYLDTRFGKEVLPILTAARKQQ